MVWQANQIIDPFPGASGVHFSRQGGSAHHLDSPRSDIVPVDTPQLERAEERPAKSWEESGKAACSLDFFAVLVWRARTPPSKAF